MAADLVIGLDGSTQSIKAIAWTREGEALAEGRAAISSDSPHAGWVEQSVEDWWQATCTALTEVSSQIDPARIAGLAISSQRETVAFLDSSGLALRPAIVWLDERALEEVKAFSQAFGAERLHAITGKPIDITPVVYRLSWMRRHEPDLLDRSERILDVHGFLSQRLTGRAVASWTSADPFGLLDIAEKAWSEDILERLGLSADRLGSLLPPGATIGPLSEVAAAHCGLKPATPVIAAGGDGQCAGLGVNAAKPGSIYLNLGTALITGAWSATPAIGRYWRTMISPTGEGYFLEGCQRAGAYFVNWLIDSFAGGRDDPAIFDRLEAEAAAIPVGSEGLLVCPYLVGCMDPHWDPAARASFEGFSAGHGIGHLYRAALEALTLESARCVAAMAESGIAASRIMAVGGGANSRIWTRMFADATGLPLIKSRSLEASALGAGMSAAVGVGWFEGFDTAAAAMSSDGEILLPDPTQADLWTGLSNRQARTYRPG